MGDGTGIGGHLLKKTINAIKAVVGTNADEHLANTISGKVIQLVDHFHSVAMVTPELANPVTLTKAAGAWAAYPTPTEIVPAGGIGNDFDIHFVVLSAISANGDYTITIYSGAPAAEVAIGHIAFARNAVQSQEGAITTLTPIQPADTRISAALSSGNVAQDTSEIKLLYHTY